MSEQDVKLDSYFNDCLYFSLSRLQRCINKMAEDSFAKTGLAPSHAFILMALDENKELGAGQVAELIGIAPSTVTRFIDKLEKAGYCCRKVKGRTSLISITAKGRKLIPKIHKGWSVLFETYNEVYGKEEAATLNDQVVAMNNQYDNYRAGGDK